MALVYQDLKRIAHGQMARISPGQTLSTTVLVHEAFEKLAAQGGLPVRERTGFYALCACAMRPDHRRPLSAPLSRQALARSCRLGRTRIPAGQSGYR